MTKWPTRAGRTESGTLGLMSVAHGRRIFTRADLEALPDGVKGEIIDGELFTQPRPRARHSRAASFLTRHLGGSFDYDDEGPGGWVILAEPGIELPDAPEVAPDLAGWRKDRFEWPKNEEAICILPDWVCEVLSPSNARWDRTKKFPFYARVGVGWLWVIDPVERTLEVRRSEHGLWIVIATYAEEDRVRAEPFDAIDLPLKRLWVTPKET